MIKKPKRNRHLKFRATGRQVGPAMPEPEKRITFLGTITTEPDTVTVFDIPLDASPTAIAAALREAEAERAEAQVRETEKFLKDERR
jgi:hypothetical protein